MKEKMSKFRRFFNFHKWFSNNKFVACFSLFAAFCIWLWISIDKSPIVENVIVSVPVYIETENSVPSQLGLKVFGNSNYTVDVTVSGKKFVVSLQSYRFHKTIFPYILIPTKKRNFR